MLYVFFTCVRRIGACAKVAFRPPDWKFSECPMHLDRGVMSTSFRLLESGSGEGRQGQRKSKEWAECKLHKLHGLHGLHGLHEVDGGREGRVWRGWGGVGRD